MSRRTIFVMVGCVTLLCIIGCVGLVALIGGGVFFLTKPVADTGSDFMKHVRAGEYDAAYAMCASSLQQELGSAAELREFFVEYNRVPEEWTFTNTSVENNRGTMRGTVTLASGDKRDLELNFIKEDGDWRVSGFRVG